MVRLELQSADDPASECVKTRVLDPSEAVLILSTMISHRVAPLMITLNHSQAHYECLRLDQQLYLEWSQRDENGHDMRDRLDLALCDLSLYVAPRESSASLQEQDNQNQIDSADVRYQTNSEELRRGWGVPSSTQEVQDRYPAQENEDAEAKTRRKRNMSAAMRRMRDRRQRAEQAPKTTISTDNVDDEERHTVDKPPHASIEVKWEKHRQREAQRRSNMSEEQKEKSRHTRKANKDKKKQANPVGLCIALASIDEFEESARVIGADIGPSGRHLLIEMTFECPYCGALDWKQPKNQVNTRCCLNGAIEGPNFDYVPEILREMFQHPLFRVNARKYNLIFQFTSTGAVVNQQLASREGGVNTYNVQGRIVHRMGILLPLDEAYPRMFAQVYIFDGNMQYDLRTEHPELGLNNHFIKLLTDYINEHNEYAKAFVRAGQFMIENPGRHIHLKLHERGDTDPRTRNLPKVSEVAALIVDDEYLEEGRDIIVRMKPTKDPVTGKIHALQRISELHECYDPMAWPIVYLRGEPGLNPIKSRMPKDGQKKNIDFGEESSEDDQDNIDDDSGKEDDIVEVVNELEAESKTEDDGVEEMAIVVQGPAAPKKRAKITFCRWIRYQLFFRKSRYNHLHQFGPLLQEICVDQFAKIITSDLQYARKNQRQLRADLYHDLIDRFRRDLDWTLSRKAVLNSGKFNILPAKFVGSPRYMDQVYQDSMAIVRTYGTPDAFVTVTCNPKWEEIERELEYGQKAEDRPELVARVFNEKLKAILHDILKKHIFGKVLAYIYVIEYQKRGLPHAHILLIFHKEYKPRTTADFDRFVSAEIPDREKNP